MRKRILLLPVLFLVSALLAPAANAAAGPTGTIVTVAGGNGTGSASNQVNLPRGIAIDDAGTLYVADTENHRVQRVTFDIGGTPTYTTVGGTDGQGNDPTELYSPSDVVPAADGSLYVIDTWNHRLQRITFDLNGDPEPATTVYGGNGYNGGVNDFAVPSGIALASDGTVFVSDRDNDRVQKIAFDGSGNPNLAITVAGGNGRGSDPDELNSPHGIALDSEGSLYIADAGNHRIQKVTFDGDGNANAATTIFGGLGAGTDANSLNTPWGVVVRSDGSMYVSDTGNERILNVGFDGDGDALPATTVAGGNGGGSADNQFNTVSGIALDTDNGLFIADPYNHRIRTLTLEAIVVPDPDPDPDVTAPLIVLAAHAETRVGETTTVSFSCEDVGTAGLQSCTATLNDKPVLNGDVVPATSRGTQTLVVTAVDTEGNTSTKTTTFESLGARELVGDFKDLDGDPAAVARLYLAAFARVPEATGFSYWKSTISSGMSLQDMANHFANGTEFKNSYSTTTNSDFVDFMYERVLARSAEPEGHAFWLAQLDAGMPKAELLLWFSGSPEFKGITYTS